VVRPTLIEPPGKPPNPVLVEGLNAYLQRTARPLPMCPEAITAEDAAGRLKVDLNTPDIAPEEAERWAVRGAMNAGMSVFVYLDALSKGQVKPKPKYNRCEELGK
jgi:hypothetical protein